MARVHAARSRQRRGGSDLRTFRVRPGWAFVVALVVMFCNFALWSIATPLYASPDEPAQMVHAVAVVRGQLVGKTSSPTNEMTAVTIPEVFAAQESTPICFATKDVVPASCAKTLSQSKQTVSSSTSAGRYPPLYFGIVGLPSLFAVSNTGIYLMRVVSSLLNALFLALAVYVVVKWSRRRLLLVGLLVAATPMVWFLGAVINPNGFEICAATCFWTAVLVLLLEHDDRPARGLLAVVVGSGAALMLARGLSPLWVAVILLVVAVAAGARSVLQLLRQRGAQIGLLVLFATGLLAVSWIVFEHALDLGAGAPPPHHETTAHLLAFIAGYTYPWIEEMIGVFGWLDTFPPTMTYLIYFAVLGALIMAVFVAARARSAWAMVLLLAVVVGAPIALQFDQMRSLGFVWQDRYMLPVAVGVPLLAAATIGRPWRSGEFSVQRSALVLSGLVGAADLFAFEQALRRYVVGVTGPLNFFGGPWQPPLGALGLSIAEVLAIAALVGMTWLFARSPRWSGLGELGSDQDWAEVTPIEIEWGEQEPAQG